MFCYTFIIVTLNIRTKHNENTDNDENFNDDIDDTFNDNDNEQK